MATQPAAAHLTPDKPAVLHRRAVAAAAAPPKRKPAAAKNIAVTLDIRAVVTIADRRRAATIMRRHAVEVFAVRRRRSVVGMCVAGRE
jgi:hypothetical protein